MQKIINQFIGATLIASQFACGHSPSKNEPANLNHNDSVATQKDVPPLTEAQRNILLGLAKRASAETFANAMSMYGAAGFVLELAEKGNITQKVCLQVGGKEATDIPKDLRTTYTETVEQEVLYGGETQEGKEKRLKFMSDKTDLTLKYTQMTVNICMAKFGI